MNIGRKATASGRVSFGLIRTAFVIYLLLGSTATIKAQISSIAHLIPPDFDHIHVHPLESDTNSSSYIIWVKDQVDLHMHKHHTEDVYVLEGTGRMQLGDSVFVIQPHDYIRIVPMTPHAVTTTSDRPLKVISIQSPQFFGQDRHFIDLLRK